MGRFRNLETGIVVSVDDSKDERFTVGFEPADKEPKQKAPAKRPVAKPEK